MKKIDQTGGYHFSDANVGQTRMLRFDNPEDYIELLSRAFSGKRATYDDLKDFALNETPFINPKSMLALLEKQQMIEVENTTGKRRKFTFNPDNIKAVTFVEAR